MRMLSVAAAAAAFAALALSGCNTAATTSDVQTALTVGCPILASIQAAVQAKTLSPNAAQKAALTTLAIACPPNPPPTSAVVAVADLIAAYTTLQPLLNK